jgi:hypothetical protein
MWTWLALGVLPEAERAEDGSGLAPCVADAARSLDRELGATAMRMASPATTGEAIASRRWSSLMNPAEPTIQPAITAIASAEVAKNRRVPYIFSLLTATTSAPVPVVGRRGSDHD